MNRFDSGSVGNVEVLGDADGGGISIRGDYTFNGGRAGWVRAVYAKGKIVCLEYWDRQGACDDVRGSGGGTADSASVAEDNSPWERLTGNMTEILVQPESDAACLMSKTIGNGGETRMYSNRRGDVASSSDHAFTILVRNTCSGAVHMQFPGFFGSANDIDIRKGDVFSLNCNTTTTMGSDTFSIPHSNESCSGGHFLKRNAQ